MIKMSIAAAVAIDNLNKKKQVLKSRTVGKSTLSLTNNK